MFDFARFHILGRVGKIKTFEKSIRVSIAANASYKKDGKWVDETDWNEIVIFDKNTIKYVSESVESGDYVRVQGRLRQNSFKREGETVYGPPSVVFQPVPEGKVAKNRVHLDLYSPDQAADVARLEGLGARRIDVGQPADATFVVLADVEGNEFCVLSEA